MTGEAQDHAQGFAQLYEDLRRLAHARLRRHQTFTLLGTTALVHETFMRLRKQHHVDAAEQGAFMAYAAQVMRSVIVDHARARLTQRRGEHPDVLSLDTVLSAQLAAAAPEQQVLDVHAALAVLEQAEPRLAQVVAMQFFGGFDEAEIAEALGVSTRTVRRDWEKARLLLKVALR